MFGLLKVSGNSLSPTYQDGDFVFICRTPYCLCSLKPGDVVIFHRKPYGTLIKEIKHLDPLTKEVFVVGSHPDSVDSRRFGAIPARDLIGKVICRIQKN